MALECLLEIELKRLGELYAWVRIKDDPLVSGWTAEGMVVPFFEMRKPDGKTCLRITTKKLC